MNEELLKQLLANIQNSNVSNSLTQGSQLLTPSLAPVQPQNNVIDTGSKLLTAAGAVNPILGGIGLGLQVLGGIRSSKAAKERQREQERQNYLTNVIGRLR